MKINGPMQELFPTREVRRRWQRRIRRVCSILLLACLTLVCLAQPPGMSPADVEAAYLYNFGKFVRWPADTGQDSEPFTICVLGEDSFGDSLNALVANETLQGRKVLVRKLSSPASATNCQMIFFGQSEDARLVKDLAAIEKRPVLTVSSIPGFLERGGMIQFVVQNKRVRFAVNLAAAEPSGLVLSSELLKVALYVNSSPAVEAKP
jgi:hypothetical protein